MTTKSGRVLTERDLDRLADEAEAGFDPTRFRPRRGRQFLDPAATEHSPRVSIRLPASLRERVAEKAAHEGRTLSQVIRDLLEAYADD